VASAASATAEAETLGVDVAEAVVVGDGFVVHELWNLDGLGPTDSQREVHRAATQRAAGLGPSGAFGVGALADGGGGDGGPEVLYLCPWPGCGTPSRTKRGRASHLRAHRRASRAELVYSDVDALNVPPALLCPLSEKLMFEAVTSADGYTFDRSSLEASPDATVDDGAAQTPHNPASTVAAAAVRARGLRPNWTVRRLVHEWCLAVGLEPPPASDPATAPPRSLVELRRRREAPSSSSSSSSSDEEDFAPAKTPSAVVSKAAPPAGGGNWAIRGSSVTPAMSAAEAAAAAEEAGSAEGGRAAATAAKGPRRPNLTGSGARRMKRVPSGYRTATLDPAALAAFYGLSLTVTAAGVGDQEGGVGEGAGEGKSPRTKAAVGASPRVPRKETKPKPEAKPIGDAAGLESGEASHLREKKGGSGGAEAAVPGPVPGHGDDVFKVERIEDVRTVAGRPGKPRTREYLLAWAGYGSESNSWEPEEHVLCDHLVGEGGGAGVGWRERLLLWTTPRVPSQTHVFL